MSSVWPSPDRQPPSRRRRATCVRALVGGVLGAVALLTAACEPSCPQQPTACGAYRQLRLDYGAQLPQSSELSAYRLTIRYATKQAGEAASPGGSGAAGQAGDAGAGGAAGESGAAGGAGAAPVNLDGVQQCVFTTPLDELSSFRCDAGPFYVTAEATSSASCGFVPGPGISVGCSGSAQVFTVLRTAAPIADVTVAIERNDEAFLPVAITIPTETVYPDGPSCGSRCEQGSATLFVDALLANPDGADGT